MVAESSESQAKAKAKATTTTTTTQRELPDGFVCPITCLVMRDPVMLTGDGHTYERHAIECWLNSKGKKVSPLTGAALGDNCLLVPNHAVRKAIAELKVDVPTQSEIESLCGGGDRDEDKDKDGLRSTTGEGEEGGKDPYFVPFSKQRTYFEDKMFVFASLRRNLYSLESTVCVWKAGQLCLPSRVTTSVVDTSWQSTLKAQVTCMKALDMNKVVVSGSRDKLLRVWDTEPTSSSSSSSSSSSRDGVRHLRQVYSLPGHTDWVNCVEVSKDEEVVVSGSRDNTLKVWNTMKWQCNHTMRTGDIINCVAFDKVKNDFFVSGGNDWKLLMWDSETLRHSQELTGHTYAIKCCAVDPVRAAWIVSSGDDSKLLVHSTAESKECMVEIEGAGGDYNESINCCDISSDGRVLACGLANKRIALWDTRMWKLLQKLDGHASSVEDLCFVPGFGQEKLVSVDGRGLKSWSCESHDWTCTHTVKAHAIACCRMALY